jgi:hypothetical protein
VICLKRNKFGIIGNSTIFMAIFLFTLWLVYYFVF